jgi:hypothetical protein
MKVVYMSTKQLVSAFALVFMLSFVLFLLLATYAGAFAGPAEDAALVSGFNSWRQNGRNFPLTQLKTWLAVTAPKGQVGPQGLPGPIGPQGPIGPPGASAVIPPLDAALQTALQKWLAVQVPPVVP